MVGKGICYTHAPCEIGGADGGGGEVASRYIILTMYGSRWVLETSGEPLCKEHGFPTTVLYM